MIYLLNLWNGKGKDKLVEFLNDDLQLESRNTVRGDGLVYIIKRNKNLGKC